MFKDDGSAEVFGKRLGEYAKLVEKLNRLHYQGVYNTIPHYVDIELGRRYARVMVGNSIHTFIDIRNGDIIKNAGRTPAKNGVRGNIFSDDLGASCINWFGTKYLK